MFSLANYIMEGNWQKLYELNFMRTILKLLNDNWLLEVDDWLDNVC